MNIIIIMCVSINIIHLNQQQKKRFARNKNNNS